MVVPARRGGAHLRTAVSSLLEQTVVDLEVVVVADGCPDDLEDLETGDPRVRLIRQDHAGVSVARNVGIARSRGLFVAFLDEDDRAHPARLGLQLAAFRSAPGAGVCHCRYQVVDAGGVVRSGPYGSDVQYADMLALSFPRLSTLMVRRTTLDECGGFDPALLRGEDVEFMLRAGMRTRLVFVPEVVVDYRRHRENTSTGPLDVYPVIQKHRWWATSVGRPDLVAAADLGLRRNRHNASRAAFDDGRAARRRGDLVGTARSMAVSLARDPSFVPAVLWSRVTGRPGASPEGSMPSRARGRARPSGR